MANNKRQPAAPDILYKVYLTLFAIILAIPLLPLPFWWLAGYFTPPDFGKTIVFKIVFSILLCLIAYDFLFQKTPNLFNKIKKPNFKNLSFWLLLSLLCAYILATIFSVDIRFSLWGTPYRGGGTINNIFYILCACALFFIVKAKDWERVWDFAIGTGALVSIVALISRLGLFKSIFLAQTDQLTSTTGGPTVLGLYIVLLVFPSLAFAIQSKNSVRKLLYFASFLLFCLLIFLTISQGAYLALAAGILYFLLFYPANQKNKWAIWSIKLGAIILIVIAVSIVLVVKSNPNDTLKSNYLFRTLTNWHMDQSRVSAWKVAFKAFVHRPIFGYGPENFSIAFDKYYDPSLPELQRDFSGTSSSWWDRPHNIILNMLSDIGVVGLVAYLTLFGYLFFQLYTLRKTEKGVIAHGLQATFVAYFLDLIFNFDSYSSFIIAFLIVAYAQSLLINQEPAPNEPRQFKKPAKILASVFGARKVIMTILVIFFLYFIWFLNVRPILANKKINEAEYFASQGKCDIAMHIMDGGLTYHTTVDSYYRIKYVDFLRTCSQYEVGHDREFAQKGIGLLKESVKTSPSYTRSWLMLGALSNVVIATEEDIAQKQVFSNEAETYFKKAIELSPKRQETMIEWIKKDIFSGDYQKAVDKAETCISLNSKIPECYWYGGLAEIYLNDQIKAKHYFDLSAQRGFDGLHDIPYINQLILAYSAIKDYPKLEETYFKLLALTDAPQYHASLAFIYREMGRYAESRRQAMIFLWMAPEAKEEVDEFLKTLPY